MVEESEWRSLRPIERMLRIVKNQYETDPEFAEGVKEIVANGK